MTPEWIYLLKVNVGIALFYTLYKLLCQRDTFFLWRRTALLSFVGISFAYPLLNIQDWVSEQPTIAELANYYATIAWDEITVTVPATNGNSRLPDLATVATYIYLTGVIAFGLRFIVQLSAICRIRWTGKSMYVDGQRIISLPTETSPFSFFQWIFLHLPSLQEDSRKEIIMHEQAHAHQWHSADVVLYELTNIVCWFNPFVWLLKSEVRLNLEYLADDKVTETMQNRKQYQYHLVEIANIGKQSGLYNNFNVSHLKKRIMMMNKKRTRMTGHLKYVLFAPVVALLLIAGNISCTSSKKNEPTETPAPVEEKVETPTPAPTEAPAEAPESKTADDTVYSIVEEQPEFPDGPAACLDWINSHLSYPPIALEKGIQGRVTITFIVNADGSISDATAIKGVDPDLDKEAIRVISQMPKWKPGKQNGKAVRCRFNLPVRFVLK